MKVLAIDIGGTAIKIAEVGAEGKILSLKEASSEAKKGGPYLMEKVINIIKGYEGYERIGISTAGQVDAEKGLIIFANENIPNYTGMEIKKMIEENFHVPVAVENDVNAAALGEAHYGAGKGYKDFLCLTYGTGIGGAIIMDKKVYKGMNGVAGEFGHMIIHPDQMVCGCGGKGCYEQYASTTALIRKAREVDAKCDSGRMLFELINGGNKGMKEVLDKWIGEVMIGLTTLIHIFNPSCIILGGGVLSQPYIIEQINERLWKEIMPSYRGVKIINAKLGNCAGVLGAAYLALQS